MDIRKKVKSLHLPEDSYVLVAGAVLALHGIRKTHDIDIAVTDDVYENLKQSGWEEFALENGDRVLREDVFEIGKRFHFGTYQTPTQYLIETADIVQGIPCASLQEILRFKMAINREKDREDIKLINTYLRSRENL